MRNLIDWFKDQLLAFAQRGCKHPLHMVSADILESAIIGYEVKHCRRCGAVKVVYTSRPFYGDTEWRLPDPNLWRGL